MARRLADLWIPAAVGSASFVDQTQSLDAIWERSAPRRPCSLLLHELTSDRQSPSPVSRPRKSSACAWNCSSTWRTCSSPFAWMISGRHPDNRGWAATVPHVGKEPDVPCLMDAVT